MTIPCVYAGVTFSVDNNMSRIPWGETNYSSTNRNMRMEAAGSSAVNDAMMEFTEKKEDAGVSEPKVTDVIKEQKPIVPAASFKSTYTSTKESRDPSSPYGMGATNIPSGVNDSKTIYTDGLGRLHFFGKANQIRETQQK